MEKQTLNHRKDRNPRQVKQVFHGMKGGIPVKVHHSTTPKSEKCTDPNLAKYRVNRLQTRIAKATKDIKWNLVKRIQTRLPFFSFKAA